MTTSCSAIINVSYGTIRLLLHDTSLQSQTFYRERYLEDLKLAWDTLSDSFKVFIAH